MLSQLVCYVVSGTSNQQPATSSRTAAEAGWDRWMLGQSLRLWFVGKQATYLVPSGSATCAGAVLAVRSWVRREDTNKTSTTMAGDVAKRLLSAACGLRVVMRRKEKTGTPKLKPEKKSIKKKKIRQANRDEQEREREDKAPPRSPLSVACVGCVGGSARFCSLAFSSLASKYLPQAANGARGLGQVGCGKVGCASAERIEWEEITPPKTQGST